MNDDVGEPDLKRYLRNPRVVFVRQLDEDHFEVTDENKEHPYQITKDILRRDYEELF